MEANLDGLVGPTYLFGGLSPGNIASMTHKGWISHPQKAALEGLEKMWHLARMGILQGVLPPQERPYLPTLRLFGFRGTDEEVLAEAAQKEPFLLLACSSASSMWLANSATVFPSSDTEDRRVHFSVASLQSTLHRSLEPLAHARMLKQIFADPRYFVHHPPLPVPDEGAANHLRFCRRYEEPGVHLFVYGATMEKGKKQPVLRFPIRQVREASHAIARRAGLHPDRVVFAQQDPAAVEEGVFHNDLISFGNQNVWIYHERAFLHMREVVDEIQRKALIAGISPFYAIAISEQEIPLSVILESYFCNSQLMTNRTGQMILLVPQECRNFRMIVEWIEDCLIRGPYPINEVIYVPLHESMHNGGGPACLRLPVVLTEEEKQASHEGIWLTEALYERLKRLIRERYRQRLHYQDLADPLFYREVREIWEEFSQIFRFA